MFICNSNHECWLIYFQSMIILMLKWFRRNKVMAQRRAEKPKKIKISPKQQELYSRLKSSKKWRRKEGRHEMQSMRWSYGLWEFLQSGWRFFWMEMHFLRRDRWSGYFRESNQAKGLMPRMGMKYYPTLRICAPNLSANSFRCSMTVFPFIRIYSTSQSIC